MGLKQNTWKLNQWYDQDVAGNVSYSGTKELWGWGQNAPAGTIGVNDAINYSSPVQIPGTTWSIAPTQQYVGAIVIKTDGTLWAWGNNGYGTVGDNTTINRSSPTQVGSATNWSKAQTGQTFQAALNTSGELWVWGGNGQGQLGQNQPGSSHKSSPVQVASDKTWSDFNVSSGYLLAAVNTAGELWVWGRNEQGELGQNNRTSYSSPIQVGSDTTWSGVIGGSLECVTAFKTDGTLWVWGQNSQGELGINSVADYSSPVQLPGTTWSTFSGTYSGYFALKTDGTLWAWGNNSKGQLGQNSVVKYSSPVQIPGTDWSKIASSGYSGMAMKTDGTLFSVGYNDKGQLGQNNRTAYSSPVQIPGTSWSDIGPAKGSQVINGPYWGIKNI